MQSSVLDDLGCLQIDPVEFLSRLWRGGAHGFLWVVPGKVSHWIETAQMPDKIKPIHRNLYFGVHPVANLPTTNRKNKTTSPAYVRSQLPYIAAVNCLFADFDAKVSEDGKPGILRHIATLPEPSIIIDSGGGYHGYWILKEPFMIEREPSREYIRKLQGRWAQYTQADKGAKDLCRVLRVPGSVNYKDDYAPNFPTVTTVKADFNHTYTVAQLCAYLPQIPAEPSPRPITRRTSGGSWERALHTADVMIGRAADGEKHTELLKAARLLGGYVAGGSGDEHEAIAALRAAIEHKPGVKDLNAAYETIEDGIEYGKGAPL